MHRWIRSFIFFKNYFAPKLELDLIGGVRRLDVGAFILGGEIEAPRRSRIYSFELLRKSQFTEYTLVTLWVHPMIFRVHRTVSPWTVLSGQNGQQEAMTLPRHYLFCLRHFLSLHAFNFKQLFVDSVRTRLYGKTRF